MLTPSGDVKVMDFGIARVQGSEHLTTNGFMVGTPAYMAPEQVRGEEVDPRMDLYAIVMPMATRRAELMQADESAGRGGGRRAGKKQSAEPAAPG